jgi:hypothetical protein
VRSGRCSGKGFQEKLRSPASAPDSIRLMSTAAVLPLSTAEVERVFSQVKLVKCDHINRMKQVTMNNMSKKAFFRNTVKSNKVYNEILTFIIYT